MLSLVDVGEKPNQPPSTFKFPVTKIGDRNRSCQSKWFEEFGWLHYDESRNRVFCYYCVQAVQEKKLFNTKAEDAFTKSGFFNWKNAIAKFKAHESSQCHRESLEKVKNSVHKDIGDMLSAQHTSEKTQNRECLKKIIETLRLLSRQSIPLRKGKDEEDSNFWQILKMMAKHDPTLSKWLEKKSRKFCHPEIQNELLEIMALEVLRDLLDEIRESGFYSFMCDETTDLSNSEQCVNVLRWVDDSLQVMEDFIGLFELEKADSDTVRSMVQDVLTRCNLAIQKCRGQCYDGAGVMKGAKNGVAAQIKRLEARQVFYHVFTFLRFV